MGLRYGLLAALTLVLACALLWDRLHPPTPAALFPRDLPAAEDTARVVVGGRPEPAAPGDPAPAASPAPASQEIAASAADASAEREYTVVPGDTLGAIALATMGSSRRAAELAAANGMKGTDPIRVGQVLRIPEATATARSGAPVAGSPGTTTRAPAAASPAPATPKEEGPRTHTVSGGDTLFALAKRYYGSGTQWTRIAEANGLSEGDPLRVGQSLRIP